MRIGVLVVDDSATTRMILSKRLEAADEIQVVGTAANGRIALEKIDSLQPDVVLLDLEMPELDGLGTLKALRDGGSLVPVIMFSRLTERGCRATIDALLLGANDYVKKPETKDDVDRSIEQELIPKIKAIAGGANPCGGAAQVTSSLPTRPRPSMSVPRVDVVAIAASTGGPAALSELFSRLNSPPAVPVLVTQHMPAGFTTALAERLHAKTGWVAAEATDDHDVSAAAIWIAGGGRHMLARRTATGVRIVTNDDPPENSCRPSADVLLRSVADVYGERSLAIVLTGMGNDGLEGCRAVRAAGGTVWVQDEASSVVWGMPGQVAKAGLADQILPLDQLSRELMKAKTHAGARPPRT